jgi:hypothetical protein
MPPTPSGEVRDRRGRPVRPVPSELGRRAELEKPAVPGRGRIQESERAEDDVEHALSSGHASGSARFGFTPNILAELRVETSPAQALPVSACGERRAQAGAHCTQVWPYWRAGARAHLRRQYRVRKLHFSADNRNFGRIEPSGPPDDRQRSHRRQRFPPTVPYPGSGCARGAAQPSAARERRLSMSERPFDSAPMRHSCGDVSECPTMSHNVPPASFVSATAARKWRELAVPCVFVATTWDIRARLVPHFAAR